MTNPIFQLHIPYSPSSLHIVGKVQYRDLNKSKIIFIFFVNSFFFYFKTLSLTDITIHNPPTMGLNRVAYNSSSLGSH